jgi:UDP-GlcNAc3NAcA epimerase
LLPTLRILTVVGARPQFVKAAVVSRAISRHNRENGQRQLQETILHTGQHYDERMNQVFFEELEIPAPAVNLGINAGPHGQRTGAMMAGLEREMVERRPDLVLVYGDTDSTLAGALAAVKLHVPIAHVEAGLRSFDKRMPEEVNRVVTDHVADLLFCPSLSSVKQLASEGICRGVHMVGDVMIDELLRSRARAIPPPIKGPFALCTIHRADNTGDASRLRAIFSALQQSPLPVALPLHPRTADAMRRFGIAAGQNVLVLDPLSYFEMLGHLQACSFVITDSGGLQKEAYAAGKRCITVRDTTEWTELVEVGANRTVGADTSAITAAYDWALGPLGGASALYGDGHAGEAIVRILAASA